jgi:hypothetical protein
MRVVLGLVCLAAALSMMVGCRPLLPEQEMDPETPDSAMEATKGREATPTSTPDPTPTSMPPTGTLAVPVDAQALVERAKADLALELDVKSAGVTVLSVEKTEFPDASLGVPEPGKMYAQVITPGYIIQLGAGAGVYTYHGSGERVVLALVDEP